MPVGFRVSLKVVYIWVSGIYESSIGFGGLEFLFYGLGFRAPGLGVKSGCSVALVFSKHQLWLRM